MSKTELDDFLTKGPFHDIYLRKKDEDSNFYYTYVDYHQYLQYLGIIWKRIKDEHNASMEYNLQINNLLTSRQENSVEYRQIVMKSKETLDILECDIETFVVFARRFLDKVGKMVVKLTQLPPGILISFIIPVIAVV